MIILPVHTPILTAGDDLASIIHQAIDLQSGDILAVSSKALATCEDAFYQLDSLSVTPHAEEWAAATGRSPAFCQAALAETARLHGRVIGSCTVAWPSDRQLPGGHGHGGEAG